MARHDWDSPSALARRRACPGSREMEQRHGVPSTSEAARDGTHTHWLVEYCLSENIDPADMVGQEMEDDEGTFTVDDDRAARAAVMVEYVQQRRVEMGALVAPTSMYLEVKVDPGRAMNRFEMQGTSDCILVSNSCIEVIDYKDGAWQVSPNSDQLLAYLQGAVVEHGVRDSYRCTVVQPRNPEVNNAPAITSVDIDMVELEAWRKAVKADLEAADAPDAERVPSESGCRWCSAGGACRERTIWAMQGVTFPVVETDGSSTLEGQVGGLDALAAFDVTTLSGEEMGAILDAIPVAQAVFKAIQAEAVGRIGRGESVPGWAVEMGKGNRAWSADDDEVAKRLKGRKLKTDDIYERKLKSPTQILKSTKLTHKQKAWVETNLVARKDTGWKLVAADKAKPRELPQGSFGPVSLPEETPAFLTAPKAQSSRG